MQEALELAMRLVGKKQKKPYYVGLDRWIRLKSALRDDSGERFILVGGVEVYPLGVELIRHERRQQHRRRW